MDIKQEEQAAVETSENKKGQRYNYSDQELIRQLVKSRLEQGQEMEYEDLSGYELPPRSQFSFLSKPTMTIKYGKMTFNMASIRLFSDCMFILTPVHPIKKRLMVVPCADEEAASLQWSRRKESDGTVVNRTISSEEFVIKLYKMMGWKFSCRYKILGRVALAKPGPMPVLIFDLEEAIMFDSKPKEFVDEETGETKKKQIKYYPEEYKDCIGKSYNDYIEARQMNIFEFLDEYTGQSYSDLPEKENTEDNTAHLEENSAGNETESFNDSAAIVMNSDAIASDNTADTDSGGGISG